MPDPDHARVLIRDCELCTGRRQTHQLAWFWLALPLERLLVIVQSRQLLWTFAAKDFEVRYAGSLLGVFWTQLYPLLQLAVYTFVFTNVFHNAQPQYPLFLFVGLMLWTFFATAVLASAGSIPANAALVRKLFFPRELAPLSTVLLAFVDLGLSHVILVAWAIPTGVRPSWAWLAAPAILLLLGVFAAGCGLVAATLTVYFRDMQYFLQVGLLLLMFLTPIFYSAEALPAGAAWLVALNPMVTLVSSYRAIFLDGQVPGFPAWSQSVATDALLLLAGLHVFHWGQRGFPEAL